MSVGCNTLLLPNGGRVPSSGPALRPGAAAPYTRTPGDRHPRRWLSVADQDCGRGGLLIPGRAMRDASNVPAPVAGLEYGRAAALRLGLPGYLCSGGASRAEVRHLRHDLLRQELHRMMPGPGVVAVVEAEQQETAESADFVVHPLDLLDDGRGRADQPIVRRAVFRRDVAVGDRP